MLTTIQLQKEALAFQTNVIVVESSLLTLAVLYETLRFFKIVK